MKELLLVWLFLGVGTIFDVRSRMLPGRFLLASALTAFLFNALLRYQPLIEIFCGILPGGSFLVLGWMTKESVGYGDGIGILIMGMLLGGRRTLLIVTAACFLSAVYGIGRLLLKKGSFSDTMPFYPFLFAAALGGGFL